MYVEQVRATGVLYVDAAFKLEAKIQTTACV